MINLSSNYPFTATRTFSNCHTILNQHVDLLHLYIVIIFICPFITTN